MLRTNKQHSIVKVLRTLILFSIIILCSITFTSKVHATETYSDIVAGITTSSVGFGTITTSASNKGQRTNLRYVTSNNIVSVTDDDDPSFSYNYVAEANDGYQFAGWYFDENETLPIANGQGDVANSCTKTVYAKFVVQTIHEHGTKGQGDYVLYNHSIDDSFNGTFSSGNYFLIENVTIKTSWLIPSDSNVQICLNGYSISFEEQGEITIQSGATVHFDDEVIENKTNGFYLDTTKSQKVSVFSIESSETKPTTVYFSNIVFKIVQDQCSFINLANNSNSANVSFVSCFIESDSTFISISNNTNLSLLVDSSTIKEFGSLSTPSDHFFLESSCAIQSNSIVNIKKTTIQQSKLGLICSYGTTISLDAQSSVTSSYKGHIVSFYSGEFSLRGSITSTLSQTSGTDSSYSPVFMGTHLQNAASLSLFASSKISSPYFSCVYLAQQYANLYATIVAQEDLNYSSPISVHQGQMNGLEGIIVKNYSQSLKTNFTITTNEGSYHYCLILDEENDCIYNRVFKITTEPTNTTKSVKASTNNVSYQWYKLKEAQQDVTVALFEDIQSGSFNGKDISITNGLLQATFKDSVFLKSLSIYLKKDNIVTYLENAGVVHSSLRLASAYSVTVKAIIGGNEVLITPEFFSQTTQNILGTYLDGKWYSVLDDSLNCISMNIPGASSVSFYLEEDALYATIEQNSISSVYPTLDIELPFNTGSIYCKCDVLVLDTKVANETTNTLQSTTPGLYTCVVTHKSYPLYSSVIENPLYTLNLTLQNVNKWYRGTAIPMTLSGSDKNLSGIKIEYYINNNWVEDAPITVGSYPVRVSREQDETYAKFYSDAYSVTITRYVIFVNEITTSQNNYTYTGLDQKNQLSASYLDVFGKTIPLKVDQITYSRKNNQEVSFVDVDYYNVEFVFVSDFEKENYCFLFDDSEGYHYIKEYEIKKASNAILDISVPNVLCGEEVSPSATQKFGEVLFSYKKQDDSSWTPITNGLLFKTTGTYDIKAEVLDSNNYSGAELISTFNVVEKQLQSNSSQVLTSNLLEGSVGGGAMITLKQEAIINTEESSKEVKNLISNKTIILGQFTFQFVLSDGSVYTPSEDNRYRIKFVIPEKLQGKRNYSLLSISDDGLIQKMGYRMENDNTFVFISDNTTTWILVADDDSIPAWLVSLIVVFSIFIALFVLFLIWKHEYVVARELRRLKLRKMRFLDFLFKPIYKLFYQIK